MPKPMRPRALGGHDTRVIPLVLGRNLRRAQFRAVMLGHDVLLESGSVGRGVKLGWLLKHNWPLGPGVAVTGR